MTTIGLGVEAFDIPLAAGFHAGFHIDLKEVIITHDLPREGAQGAAWSDEGADGDNAGLVEKAGHFRRPADIFPAVIICKPQAGIESGAQQIAIKEGS